MHAYMHALRRFKIVWDTAGQEKYHSLAPMYYRGASAAILVYDICNAASFEALPTWLQRLKEFGPPKDKKNDTFIIIIVGNKCDLDNERQVMRESAEWFASQQGCLYMESSAREDIRVESIFQRIAKLLPEDTISCFDTSGNGARNSKNGSSSNDNDGIFKLAVQPPQQGPNTFSSIRQGVCGC
jgi:small GTP-binding protein domain